MKFFADHYAKISRELHMKSDQRKYIKRKQYDDQPYNKPFTKRELKAAIKQQKNTILAKNTTHTRITKKIPPEKLKYLLVLYNTIWEEMFVPEG